MAEHSDKEKVQNMKKTIDDLATGKRVRIYGSDGLFGTAILIAKDDGGVLDDEDGCLWRIRFIDVEDSYDYLLRTGSVRMFVNPVNLIDEDE